MIIICGSIMSCGLSLPTTASSSTNNFVVQVDSTNEIIQFIEGQDSSQKPFFILFYENDSLAGGSQSLDSATRNKILTGKRLVQLWNGDSHYLFVSYKPIDASHLKLSKKRIQSYPHVFLGTSDINMNVEISNIDNSQQLNRSLHTDGYLVFPFDKFFGEEIVKITYRSGIKSITDTISILWLP